MKRNSKKFLALFMAVAMSVTPTTALYAEEMNDADKLQNVGEQLENTETDALLVCRIALDFDVAAPPDLAPPFGIFV